jgi:hypothetical protein
MADEKFELFQHADWLQQLHSSKLPQIIIHLSGWTLARMRNCNDARHPCSSLVHLPKENHPFFGAGLSGFASSVSVFAGSGSCFAGARPGYST